MNATTLLDLDKKSYQPLPAGKYNLSIVSAHGVPGERGGIALHLRVIGGEHDGHEFKSRVFLDSGALSSLIEVLLENKQVNAYVRQTRKKDRIYNNVDHFSPAKDSDTARHSDLSQ